AEGALADGAGAGEEHRAVVEGDGSVFAEPLLSGEPVEGPQDLCHVGFDAVELRFDGPGVGALGSGVGAVGAPSAHVDRLRGAGGAAAPRMLRSVRKGPMGRSYLSL